jgi:AmiR/NasT family two-component response regulator
METSNLTPEQQEYLNDYQEWLDKRPEKISVPYVFHAQLVILKSENEDGVTVAAQCANDINYVKGHNADLIIMSMTENLIKSFEEASLEYKTNNKTLI